MNRKLMIPISAVVFMGLATACSNKSSEAAVKQEAVNKTSSTSQYKDGTYEGQEPADGEGFTSKGKLTIKNGKIISVDWNIFDAQNRVFDDKYENVYTEEVYKQQCRDDYKGEKTYGPKLIQTQDISKVDAVSGATWTNNIFKKVMGDILIKAKS